MSKRRHYKHTDCNMPSGHPDDTDIPRINSAHIWVTLGLLDAKHLDTTSLSRATNQLEMSTAPLDMARPAVPCPRQQRCRLTAAQGMHKMQRF